MTSELLTTTTPTGGGSGPTGSVRPGPPVGGPPDGLTGTGPARTGAEAPAGAQHSPAAAATGAPGGAPGTGAPRLRVENLHVGFRREGELREIVHGLSFELHPGRCVAIVGESGSGKSVTARTLVGLPGHGAEVRADALHLGDHDLLTSGERTWRRIRGTEIGFVLQDALVSLDPLRPVGAEIAEALRLHGVGPRSFRARRAVELLAAAGVPAPEV
ncbi:ATP-binding cassette domain-containing protein, partial [Nocardia zapadnayensis]